MSDTMVNGLNDLVQRLTNAIFRQEGMGPDHQNPGNLRGAPWLTGADYKGVAMARGFWAPTSRAQGVAGAAHVVALHIAEGDSLRVMIGGRPGYAGWAPAKDGNDTELYIKNVKQWAGIPDENLPLWNYVLDTAPAPGPAST